MVNLKCYHCQSENLVRNGKTNNGKQRYVCKDCGKMSRDNPAPNGYSSKERERIRASLSRAFFFAWLDSHFWSRPKYGQQLA